MMTSEEPKNDIVNNAQETEIADASNVPESTPDNDAMGFLDKKLFLLDGNFLGVK